MAGPLDTRYHFKPKVCKTFWYMYLTMGHSMAVRPEDQQNHILQSLEVVEFTRPNTSDRVLYVSKICGRLPKEEVVLKLHEAFKPYGLINDIQVYPPAQLPTPAEVEQGEKPEECSYAFVKFYLARDAAKARAGLSGKYFIGGQPILVQHATKMKKREPYPLPYAKCLEVANHFLGFDGWNSDVVWMGRDPESSRHDPNTLRYICVGRIEIRGWHLSSEGVGLGEMVLDPTSPQERGRLTQAAMNIAFNRAFQNAFSKVILVILENGKVAVEINNKEPDVTPLYTAEEEAQMLQVNVRDEETGEVATDEDMEDDNVALLLAALENYS